MARDVLGSRYDDVRAAAVMRRLRETVHGCSSYRQRHLRSDIIQRTRDGVTSFFIGLIFLVLCPALQRWLVAQPLIGDSAIVAYGLLILSRVAL